MRISDWSSDVCSSDLIITAAMVKGMRPGTVVVDLAAESGGNCELTRPGETVVDNGVSVIGPLNLASQGAIHASEMYARNLFNFAALMIKDGARSEEHTSELQSLMRISYAVFCLKNKKHKQKIQKSTTEHNDK